jgi:hypothetical protein
MNLARADRVVEAVVVAVVVVDAAAAAVGFEVVDVVAAVECGVAPERRDLTQ